MKITKVNLRIARVSFVQMLFIFMAVIWFYLQRLSRNPPKYQINQFVSVKFVSLEMFSSQLTL